MSRSSGFSRLSQLTRCKSCQAPIYWVKMAETGKNMPLDADEILIELRASAVGEKEISGVTPTGYMRRGVVNELGQKRESATSQEVFVRQSHFASCVNARKHRKSK